MLLKLIQRSWQRHLAAVKLLHFCNLFSQTTLSCCQNVHKEVRKENLSAKKESLAFFTGNLC